MQAGKDKGSGLQVGDQARDRLGQDFDADASLGPKTKLFWALDPQDLSV
jgi:hypothetical protein